MMTSRFITAIGTVILLYMYHATGTSVVTSIMNPGTQTEQMQDDPKQEAQRLWELALAAKGGRERLYNIRNTVISSRSEYMTTSQRKNQLRTESLFVFPNKLWSWDDNRPDVLGLRVEMYNFDTNMHYIINPDYPHDPPRPIMGTRKSDSYTYGLVSYLLESRWLKPILLNVRQDTIGHQKVDIVQTKVNDYRVDFAMDRQTRLPIRVTYYHMQDGKEVFDLAQDLSEYTEVGGIKVPQMLKDDEGGMTHLRLQFNVEYDESIFVRPPPIEAGPEAWRPKMNKSRRD
jgi:hypothetical protein